MILAKSPVKYLIKFSKYQLILFCVKLFSGNVNSLNSLNSVPDFVIIESLVLLKEILLASKAGSFSSNEILALKELEELNGKKILEYLIGHPNNEKIAELSYGIYIDFFNN